MLSLPAVVTGDYGSTHKDLLILGELMNEISSMLELSNAQRNTAVGNIERALKNFDEVDATISQELQELPGDLDVYLRLCRNKKRTEERRSALEAQSQVSHALNFHLGGGTVWGGAGPSLMDDLRAEEESLERATHEAEAAHYAANGGLPADNDYEDRGVSPPRAGDKGSHSGGLDARGGREGKAGRANADAKADAKAAKRSAERSADLEAYQRYNLRDGLFAHLDAAAAEEAQLEARVAGTSEGSRARLDAEADLVRFRVKESDEVRWPIPGAFLKKRVSILFSLLLPPPCNQSLGC
jgi:hypothetical protein